MAQKQTAAGDALTREIEALRDALAGARAELAWERGEQEAVLHDLHRLRETLRDFDEAQREMLTRMGPPAS